MRASTANTTLQLVMPYTVPYVLWADGAEKLWFGLDTPYEAAVQARKDAEKAKEPLPPEPEKPVEDKPFLLDGLIK